MSKVIELRVTKTDVEQMIMGTALLSFLQAATGNESNRPADALHILLMYCVKHELEDLISRDTVTESITLSEKHLKRLEKLLDAYNKLAKK